MVGPGHVPQMAPANRLTAQVTWRTWNPSATPAWPPTAASWDAFESARSRWWTSPQPTRRWRRSGRTVSFLSATTGFGWFNTYPKKCNKKQQSQKSANLWYKPSTWTKIDGSNNNSWPPTGPSLGGWPHLRWPIKLETSRKTWSRIWSFLRFHFNFSGR